MSSWATFWTAVRAIAAVLASALPFLRRRNKRRYRLFLSMQMSQLSDVEYKNARQQVLNAIYEIRKHDDVYFHNEFVPDRNAFDEKSFDAHDYLDEIRKADYFVAVLSERIFSSIYFEAGFAIALGKPSFYFILDPKAMPLLMRTAVADHPSIKVTQLSSIDELEARITHLLSNRRRYK